jgi:hypothetical protein
MKFVEESKEPQKRLVSRPDDRVVFPTQAPVVVPSGLVYSIQCIGRRTVCFSAVDMPAVDDVDVSSSNVQALSFETTNTPKDEKNRRVLRR